MSPMSQPPLSYMNSVGILITLVWWGYELESWWIFFYYHQPNDGYDNIINLFCRIFLINSKWNCKKLGVSRDYPYKLSQLY